MLRRLWNPWVGKCLECGGTDAEPGSAFSHPNRKLGCLIDGCLSFPFICMGPVFTFLLDPLLDPWYKANLVRCRTCGTMYRK